MIKNLTHSTNSGLILSEIEVLKLKISNFSFFADEELVEKILRHDREALGELFRRYHKRFFNLAYRFSGDYFTADDLTSEIFLRIYRYLRSFDRAKASFKTWAFKIASNTCLTFKVQSAKFKVQSFSSKLKIDEDGEEQEFEVEDDRVNLVQEVVKDESSQRIQNALNSLPDKFRLCHYLFYFEDLKYEEIADTLEFPINTVRTHLRRGKEKLKEALRDLF